MVRAWRGTPKPYRVHVGTDTFGSDVVRQRLNRNPRFPWRRRLAESKSQFSSLAWRYSQLSFKAWMAALRRPIGTDLFAVGEDTHYLRILGCEKTDRCEHRAPWDVVRETGKEPQFPCDVIRQRRRVRECVGQPNRDGRQSCIAITAVGDIFDLPVQVIVHLVAAEIVDDDFGVWRRIVGNHVGQRRLFQELLVVRRRTPHCDAAFADGFAEGIEQIARGFHLAGDLLDDLAGDVLQVLLAGGLVVGEADVGGRFGQFDDVVVGDRLRRRAW